METRSDLYEKAAGHRVLAGIGKQVLRPGGMDLTRWMLRQLTISPQDEIVEIAPGLGRTAKEIFRKKPASYIGIDANPGAIEVLRQHFSAPNRQFLAARADATGLADCSASVFFGEAFLTMQGDALKKKIVDEAYRILRPRGRYGIHELCIISEDSNVGHEVRREISRAIRSNVSPLAASDWAALLRHAGFKIKTERIQKMELLKLTRVLRDEGPLGTLRLALNAALHPSALVRMVEMHEIFDRYYAHLGAISIVAEK